MLHAECPTTSYRIKPASKLELTWTASDSGSAKKKRGRELSVTVDKSQRKISSVKTKDVTFFSASLEHCHYHPNKNIPGRTR